MKHYFIGAFLLLLNFGICKAQEEGKASLSFSLNDAVEYALENNTDILNARLDIQFAKKEVWKTTAIGLPHATGTLDYQHIPGDLPTFSFPNGDGTFSEIPLGVKNSSTYSLTVSQLVFSGEYIVGLQAARTYLELSENSKTKSIQDTKANVISSYYAILILEKNKEFLDSSLVNMKKTLRETKALMESGFLEDSDYEQILISHNGLENSAKAVARQIELGYLFFKVNLGIGIETNVKLSESMDDLLLELNMEALLVEEFILENNLDYQILSTQEKVSELSLKREKTRFLPSLSAFYLYSDKTNKAAFDFTINHIVGLNLGVPIFSSGQRLATVSQARIDLEKTQNTKLQVGETLVMAVEQAKSDFKTAWEKYQTEYQNIQLAEKIYTKTLIKYKEGMASSMDVTQANNQYLDNASAYSTSIIDMLNAKTFLEKATSNL